MNAPTKTEQILRLVENTRLTYREIAERIGSTEASVGVLICRVRNSGKPRRDRPGRPRSKLPSPGHSRTVTMKISCDVYAALAAEADARGVSMLRLCTDVVAAVADDDLFSSVLED